MRSRTTATVFLSLCVFSAGLDPAKCADNRDSESLRQQIDEIVEPYVTARDFMGVVAIQQDGKDSLILPYGLASVELDSSHDPDSIFMIGSISKQFTAVAILMLEEDGLLQTSDAVGKHLPQFPHGSLVTIEQLLTHTSGIADVYSLARFGATGGQGGTLEAVIEDLGQMDLTHPPGEAYAYSNGGYSVLAAIIEGVSGLGYGEFLKTRLFEPLDLESTDHDSPSPARRHRVPGYDPWGQSDLTPVASISPAFSAGSGSLWSSAGDLLAWNAALHRGQILQPASYRKLVHDYGNGYGYGVSAFERLGRKVIGHDGRVAGYASDAARYVDENLTIVVLSNVQSVARDEIRHAVAAAVLDQPVSAPASRRFAEASEIDLAELVGVYAFGSFLQVTLIDSNGRLLARANEGGFSELIPMHDDEWFSRMLYTTVRFGRNEQGAVDRLIWGPGDSAPVGPRVR